MLLKCFKIVFIVFKENELGLHLCSCMTLPELKASHIEFVWNLSVRHLQSVLGLSGFMQLEKIFGKIILSRIMF